MTRRTADVIADGILAAAVLGAGYVIWRTPRLRRMAAGLVLAGVTGTLPGWFGRELQEAWAASDRSRPATRAAI